MPDEPAMSWLRRMFCHHTLETVSIDSTDRHDGFAIVFGNTVVRQRCSKCGKRVKKIGYMP